jgi:ribose transport system substrate-binding protein
MRPGSKDLHARRPGWRRAGAVILPCVVALALAACGGNDDSSTSASTSAGTTSSTAASDTSQGVEYAKSQIEKFKQVPQFEATGEPFDARKAAQDKTIWSIPSSSAVPFVQNIQRFEKGIAKQIGVTFKVWANQGQPAQWTQGMQSIIGGSNGNDVIDLLAGINPGALEPQIKAAAKKDIPTSVSHLFDPAQPSPVEVAGRTDIPYEQAGRLLADWAIWKTGGKANALVVTVNEVPSTEPMVNGIKDEFANHCGSECKLSFANVTIAESAQKVQPEVQTALVRDPGINYVLALYDSVEVPGVVAAITAANAGNRVKVATFNGTPSILKMIADGDIVEMDVGEDIRWIAYAIMDTDLRLLAGLDPVKDPKVGIRVFDDSNIADAGSPPKDATGYGDSYIDGYAKMWQLGG